MTEESRLIAAIWEAERFLERAQALLLLLQTPGYHHQLPERSALRRASMDLTRALALVRQPI